MKDKPDPFGTPIQTGSDWYLLLVGPAMIVWVVVVAKMVIMAVRGT